MRVEFDVVGSREGNVRARRKFGGRGEVRGASEGSKVQVASDGKSLSGAGIDDLSKLVQLMPDNKRGA